MSWEIVQMVQDVNKARYRVDNGIYSYLREPETVEVCHNGVQICIDIFELSNLWKN